MKLTRWFSAVLVLALMFVLVGGVAANGGIEGVNSFTITPSSIWAGSSGQVYINANLTSGDGTTYFCLYVPTGLDGPVTWPSTITLKYKQGFNWINANFNVTSQGGSEPSCPPESGMNSYLYKGTGLPTGEKTYVGTFNFTAPAGTSYKGNYKLIFFPEEPSPGGMEFAEAPFTLLGPNVVALKHTSTRSVLPFSLLLITVVLGATVLVLRRRA